MKSIGGYFEFELEKGDKNYHHGACNLKSGRASLLYILQLVKPRMVYLPYYTCDGLLEPFFITGIEFRFYAINRKLEPVSLPVLKNDELFIYINYFDLKRKYVEELVETFGSRLVVDCTQAFFQKGNGRSWFFNSCRKFFGTPDGSYLYAPEEYQITQVPEKNEKFIVEHLLARFNGYPEVGYRSFLFNETLCEAEIVGMSKLSEYLLSKIDYNKVIRARRSNFYYLQSVFSDHCFLDSEFDDQSVPMVFPGLWNKNINRKQLSIGNVFVPVFWNDVIKRDGNGFELEKNLASRILPLPVDHRYNVDDMVRMEYLIKNIQ